MKTSYVGTLISFLFFYFFVFTQDLRPRIDADVESQADLSTLVLQYRPFILEQCSVILDACATFCKSTFHAPGFKESLGVPTELSINLPTGHLCTINRPLRFSSVDPR